jgi:hypothetical protein
MLAAKPKLELKNPPGAPAGKFQSRLEPERDCPNVRF